MEKNILYLKCYDNCTELIYSFCNEKIEKKYTKILNEECIKYISTLEGRKKAMSIHWGSNYNVPIYICEGICLFRIDSLNLVNVYNVEKVFNNMIIFNSGDTIELVKAERNIKNKLKRVKMILEKLEN